MNGNDWPSRPISKEHPYRVCFVCLGNICRSPTAEGIFQHLVREAGLESYFLIDSSGTSGWHRGEPANQKSQEVANRHGVTLHSRSRAFDPRDLDEFDLILAMDTENHRDILAHAHREEQSRRVRLMRDFDPEAKDPSVPDPYHGGLDGFERVYQILYRSSQQLLEHLKPSINTAS
ncbi:MAG: low molecular weight protein-tyrosine-phosphatase [Balneolaceae bacterium]